MTSDGQERRIQIFAVAGVLSMIAGLIGWVFVFWPDDGWSAAEVLCLMLGFVGTALMVQAARLRKRVGRAPGLARQATPNRSWRSITLTMAAALAGLFGLGLIDGTGPAGGTTFWIGLVALPISAGFWFREARRGTANV